jgi:hypothetical protein
VASTRTIILSAELCQLAEEKFKARFGGVDELITAMLKQLLQGHALKMDEDEQHFLEERLKGLGYL